jgi:hypothetical protein
MLLNKTDDYGLTEIDPSLLKVANTESTRFLLQAELRAIQQGLQYTEMQVTKEIIYKGYVDKDGQREGVGMRIKTDGYKDYGQWHLDKRQGLGMAEFPNGNIWCGELKNGNREGFATWKAKNGDRFIGIYSKN